MYLQYIRIDEKVGMRTESEQCGARSSLTLFAVRVKGEERFSIHPLKCMHLLTSIVRHNNILNIILTHELMMFCRVQFGKEISIVIRTWAPSDIELSLAYPILDPVEAHVHRLGPLRLDGVVGKAHGVLVVRGD